MKNVLLVLSCLVVSSFSATAFAKPTPAQCAKMKNAQEILQKNVEKPHWSGLADLTGVYAGYTSVAQACKDKIGAFNEVTEIVLYKLLKPEVTGTAWNGLREEAYDALKGHSRMYAGACDVGDPVASLHRDHKRNENALRFVNRAVNTFCK